MPRLSTSSLTAMFAIIVFAALVQKAGADDGAFKVFFRVGSNTAWQEATEFGSPGRNKAAADKIVEAVTAQYGVGLAKVDTDIRETATGSPLNGTSWRRKDKNLGIGNYVGVHFKSDKSMDISVYPDGRLTGSWSMDGNRVTIFTPKSVVGGSDTHVGTIDGDKLRINFGRGERVLYRY